MIVCAYSLAFTHGMVWMRAAQRYAIEGAMELTLNFLHSILWLVFIVLFATALVMLCYLRCRPAVKILGVITCILFLMFFVAKFWADYAALWASEAEVMKFQRLVVTVGLLLAGGFIVAELATVDDDLHYWRKLRKTDPDLTFWEFLCDDYE